MRKTRIYRRIAGAGLAAGALLALALWPDTLVVDVETAARGPLVVTVDEEGRTRVRDRFVVSAPVSGRVLRIELEPGDRVARGDIVARLDAPLDKPEPQFIIERSALLPAVPADLCHGHAGDLEALEGVPDIVYFAGPNDRRDSFHRHSSRSRPRCATAMPGVII